MALSSGATRPRVSVVIATSRGGPFLTEALASLAAQTYPDVEAVLVDDGSEHPEQIASVLRQFPAVHLVRQPGGAGPSVARNIGVKHTTGELIAFLDDDDRWHPDRLRQQVDALAGSDAVASYCGMRTIDAAGAELVAADQHQADDVHDVLRRRVGIILPNLMIRRDTFVRIGGFHPAFQLAEDLDLVMKAALEGRFVFVGETLVDYRHHGSNLTRNHRELCRSIDQILRLHRWAARERGRRDLARDYDVSLAANGRFAAWTVARVARRLVAEHRYGAALNEIAWGVRFAPAAPLSAIGRRLATRLPPPRGGHRSPLSRTWRPVRGHE